MDIVRNTSRTLQFIFIKAALDLFPESQITLEHSIGKWIFGEIHQEHPLTEKEIQSIKVKMQELINKNIPIKRVKIKKDKAINIFQNYGMIDKVELLQQSSYKLVTLYELDGRYDYFYGPMWESTGVIKNFELQPYNEGFILGYPKDEDLEIIEPFVERKKLTSIFRETKKFHGRGNPLLYRRKISDSISQRKRYAVFSTNRKGDRSLPTIGDCPKNGRSSGFLR